MKSSHLILRAGLFAAAATLACSFDATGLGDEVGGATPPGLTGVSATTSGSDTPAMTTGPGEQTEGTISGAATTTTSETSTTEVTTATTMPPPPGCGDGTVDPGEDCDGGPDNQGGLDCTPTCVANVCGDSYVGAGEFCDLGAMPAPGLACTPACTVNVCGDGYVGVGEGCDDGANNGPNGACTDTCASAACGDGKVGPGEDCDDANVDNADACIDTCKAASCGDGHVQAGLEACDLGADNGAYQGACNVTCSGKGPYCGDGVWDQPIELCDGDDAPGGVDCNAMCTFKCEANRGNCNNDPVDGCEADLFLSTQHCGMCGHECKGFGNFCFNKACAF